MYVPLLLTDFLDRAVKLYGDKTAVIDDEKVVTYSELNERVNRLSHGLKELRVEKGDKVAILAPNTLEMLEGFYGAFQLGAVTVPLNIRLKPNDYLFILNHSETKVLLVDYELYDLIDPVRDQLNVEQIIVHGGHHIQLEDNDLDYETWLAQFPANPYYRADIDESDIASLLYTSGTTGDPKGVMLTHRNNYLQALQVMHHLRVSDQDVVLHVLPMFHVNGWGSIFYYTGNGATQVMLRKTRPNIIFEKLEKNNVTIMQMAPTVLNSLLQYYDESKLDLNQNVRIVIGGSAPPVTFVAKVEEELGWEFIQIYGMTETSPLTLTSIIRAQHVDEPKEVQYRMKSKAGYQMFLTNVKVVNEEGNEVTPNSQEIGEIVIRSNGVMEGYWKNEKATNEVIRNGWFHTGDMGVVDSDGHIEIVDRKKDVIISGGENISSIEVENILYEHPAVVEAAAIAIPHEKWGETPHAVVVIRDGETVTEEEIIAFARERLAHYKAPTSVSFVEELPKTGSGKIQKAHIRNEFWKGKDRMVN
ncbi:long-chain-fatty-acid--CoA ligase [Oceanobacillus piezotolerans]|uniref:Long-chain-fatty-acid--CoA ligase n=1 Tax=Oceanobacillus piezotolerans TaxID=2448030 RepID=A0A498D2L5_9BACI|nr:long-chain-fatty-acid--CoA ligase [Oceanobacillus piezotolerans]RLL41792.1 long-chain-fatty-acid--CoA ligase [Oceanobacillus piezotolerans]